MVMTVDQIVQLVAAGGGIRVNARGKTLDQLVRIAAAASHRQAKIVIKNTSFFTCDQLVSIASAGKGCVFFDDEV
jgi:hypothetical protein